MKRNIKISILAVALCVIAVFLVSCGSKDNGDTSGNASNGMVSGNGSGGGMVSEIISKGEEIVSDAVGDISGFVSDVIGDGSHLSDEVSPASSEEPSLVSEGVVSNI